MAKALGHAHTKPESRRRMAQIKRAHTLDLIVLAAEWGHGRRTGKLQTCTGRTGPGYGAVRHVGKDVQGLTTPCSMADEGVSGPRDTPDQ